MEKLPGIAKLDFDCKTATIVMNEGATLSRDAATAAIVKAGFGVTKFEGGPPPKVTAYVFSVTGIAPGKTADARQSLLGALDSPDLVVVDATGAAAVTLRGDKKTTESALADALRKAGLGIEKFSVQEWPKDPAIYEIDLPTVTDAAAAARTRTALLGLEKVFWAEVDADKRRASIRLNEPCSAIEANARAALAKAGHDVAKFRLVD